MTEDLSHRSAAQLLGDLSPEEAAAFTAELTRDPAARAHHEELTAMHAQLTDHLESAQPAPDFESRLVRAFRHRPAPRLLGERLAGWFRLPAVYIPATAAALLALAETGSQLTGERVPFANTGERTVRITTEGESRAELKDSTHGFRADAAQEPDQGRVSGESSATTASSNAFQYGAFRGGVVADVVSAKIKGLDQKELAKDGDSPLPASASAPAAPQSQPTADARKLIRNASVEVEVAAFDPAATAVLTLARQAGGYLETRNSTCLPNGKSTGTLVVKIPPAALDGFLAQLRTLGEVRNQSLGTEDVTRAYVDSDARLRNARKMEDRLLELLKTTRGKVTELLAVERELARVREQIEQLQGQLKLWDGLVAYATVTIQISERDLGQAAKYLLQERATLSLASADVPRTFQQGRSAADQAKAQTLESTLSVDGQHRATALLRVLLDPERADAFIAQAKALGRTLDFRREEERIARDGGADSADARTERDRVLVVLTITSEDETPAQRTSLQVETVAVETNAGSLRRYAAEQGIEIKDSSFSQLPDGRQVANLRLVLPLKIYPDALARVQQIGATKDLSVQRNDAGRPGSVAERAEISIQLTNPPRLVESGSGLTATLRHTFSQAVGAIMWSVRMIGVALAFLAPWALAMAAVIAAIRLVLRRRKP